MCTTKDKIVNFSLDLYSSLKEERRNLEGIWQQIADFVRPKRNISHKEEIFDSTAIISAEYLVSAVWSLIANSSSSWFDVRLEDHNLENSDVKKWLNEVSLIMKDNLQDVSSGFYHKSYEFYADLICFGSAAFYMEENLDEGIINYESIHLKDIYFHKLYNTIDTVIQTHVFTAQEAVEKFGKTNLNNNLLKALSNNSSEKFQFLQIILPNKYFNHKLINKMKFASYYIDVKHKSLVHQGGFYEFPYILARWYTNSNQIYGQSPAMGILADIKMVNAMSKTVLISAQKQVDPPILAPNEVTAQGIKTAPGGVIYGGIDPINGNQLVKSFEIKSDMSSALHLLEQRRKSIQEAFYNFLILDAFRNNVSATEVISSNEQKLRILGAKISRIQSEFLYPLLKRQYKILSRMGKIPKPPKELSINESNITIDFLNSWNKYQNLQEAIGINQLSVAINNFREFIPDIESHFNWQAILEIITKGTGISSNIFTKDN